MLHRVGGVGSLPFAGFAAATAFNQRKVEEAFSRYVGLSQPMPEKSLNDNTMF